MVAIVGIVMGDTDPLRGLDLNLLRVLQVLMEERNVSRAGRRLGLSQSATSGALARLRRALSDPLLIASPQGMVPTPRAERLAPAVRAGLAVLSAAIDDRPVFEPTRSERLFAIIATDHAQVLVLPPLVAAISRVAPGVRLRVTSYVGHEPPPGLLAGDAELALGSFARAGAPFRRRALLRDPFVSVVDARHTHIPTAPSMKRFAALSHIALSGPSHSRPMFDQLLAREGVERRVVVSVPNLLAAALLLPHGEFVFTLPRGLVPLLERLAPVRVLRPPLHIEPLSLAALWPEPLQTDPAHRWLRDRLDAL
jgi:DNA-binding transcriptional LysR family regulator